MSMPVERVKPGPGQESVWDYPRPPRAEPTARRIQVIFNGVIVADSGRAVRVLETSQAPVYYLPPDDVQMQYLHRSQQTTFCEWKGHASYFDLVVDEQRAQNGAWSYPQPIPGYEAIRDHIAFYPQLMDQCLVDGEVATPMPGGFYGGWVTRDIVGPFKGAPGTQGW